MKTEVVARTIAKRICERHPREGDDVPAWIDEHWELVAAQYEAGLINATGERTGKYSDEAAFKAVEDWYEKRKNENRIGSALKDVFRRLNKELTDAPRG